MNGITVRAAHDWERQNTALFVRRDIEGVGVEYLTPDGWVRVDPPDVPPALADIPDWLMPDVRAELGEANDAGLHEALQVERARVDKLINWTLS